MYKSLFKPLLDVLLALMVFILISPIFLLLMVLGSLIFKGSPFFVQERIGKNCHSFLLYKFKSMRDVRRGEIDSYKLDSVRMNAYGRFLRKTSLDELPNLINVLKGEMSFVGPRPLLVKYWDRYSPFQMRRHEVLPGLTGWAQINGRNSTSWEQRFLLDVWYVDNRSVWLDIKILFKTVVVVLSRKNVNQGDKVTMPEFLGNKNTILNKDKV